MESTPSPGDVHQGQPLISALPAVPWIPIFPHPCNICNPQPRAKGVWAIQEAPSLGKNNGMVWVEREFKAHLIAPPCRGQGHPALDRELDREGWGGDGREPAFPSAATMEVKPLHSPHLGSSSWLFLTSTASRR